MLLLHLLLRLLTIKIKTLLRLLLRLLGTKEIGAGAWAEAYGVLLGLLLLLPTE